MASLKRVMSGAGSVVLTLLGLARAWATTVTAPATITNPPPTAKYSESGQVFQSSHTLKLSRTGGGPQETWYWKGRFYEEARYQTTYSTPDWQLTLPAGDNYEESTKIYDISRDFGPPSRVPNGTYPCWAVTLYRLGPPNPPDDDVYAGGPMDDAIFTVELQC